MPRERCEHCDVGEMSKKLAEEHRKVHIRSEDRPHECDKCHKTWFIRSNEIAGHQKKVCHGRAVKSRAQPSQDATSSNEQPQPETREHSRGFNEQQERQQEQDREQDHPGPEQLMRERTGSPFEDDQELESGNLSGDESGPFTSSNAPSQPTKPLPHRPFPELHSLFARERHHQNSNQWNFHRRSRVVLHKTGNERPVDPDSRHVEPQREPFERHYLVKRGPLTPRQQVVYRQTHPF